MSVNLVFGENLRLLARSRGSLSHVAEDLGVTRVQLQRYLRGESFPKPASLQRICVYFGVDARILLEPLAQQAALVPLTAGPVPQTLLSPDLAEVLAWAMRGNDYALSTEILPDGIYRCWVAETSRRDTYYCMTIQVYSTVGPRGNAVSRARATRSYFDRAQFSGPRDQELRQRREVRGLLLGLPDGFLWVAFNPAPIHRITIAHFAPNPVVADGSFVGFLARGRAELPGFNRVARAFLEPAPGTCGAVLAFCRTKPVYRASEVPPAVIEHISDPVEWSFAVGRG